VKRLPVVDDAGRLVGIVSRVDVLSVFGRPDNEIRDQVVKEIKRRPPHAGGPFATGFPGGIVGHQHGERPAPLG